MSGYYPNTQESGDTEMSHKKAEALILLNELMVRFMFTAQALQARGESPEAIETMLKAHDDQVAQLRDLIYTL